MSQPKLIVTADFVDEFNSIVKKFRRDDVLVGIPAEKAPRRDEDGINNATILALNVIGSPANNIPSRDVMSIGIRNAQPAIAEAYKQAVIQALSKGVAALPIYYNRVGIIASTSIKKAINSQEGIAPPAASTLDAREARGFKGTKALIVTGQMRNAITYVVKGEE